jgi:hypothetical protein
VNKVELSRELLCLEDPLVIKEIKVDHQGEMVVVFMDFPSGTRFPCPACEVMYGVNNT